MFGFMALRDNPLKRKQKKTGLEDLALSELIERLVNEIIAHRQHLSEAVESEKQYMTKGYEEKIEPLRIELFRREQLYLEYHKKFIGF